MSLGFVVNFSGTVAGDGTSQSIAIDLAAAPLLISISSQQFSGVGAPNFDPKRLPVSICGTSASNGGTSASLNKNTVTLTFSVTPTAGQLVSFAVQMVY